MITLQNLRDARALIATPDKWTKGTSALTATGHFTTPNHPHACKFCMAGAIAHTINNPSWTDVSDQLLKQGLISDFDDVWKFNDDDNTTHDKMLAYLDKLILTLSNQCDQLSPS